MKTILRAKDQLESICEYRFNECIVKEDNLSFHSHEYYELHFLVDSPQMHYVNGSVIHLPKNSLVFVRPNDYHDFYNDTGRDVTILHLALSCEMIDGMLKFLSPVFSFENLIKDKYSPYVILNSVEAKSLLKMIDTLNTIAVDDKITKGITMRAVLTQIFSRFFYKPQMEKREDIPLWLADTCTAMNKVSNFSVGLERMTELSGKTKEHLCRSVKKYYGITASDFINDLRLTYIANRLLNSDLPIIDICYESGFSNLGWMYTLFKKKYGFSPAVFKKKNIQN
ncbi:MAG: helix-turn-helix domain-containing protein [Clostridia bacterium]|nr:helix-turn-helix domain-containing protein [Clostridia bacterium]